MDKELRESIYELKKSMDTARRLDKMEAKVNRWNLFFNINDAVNFSFVFGVIIYFAFVFIKAYLRCAY